MLELTERRDELSASLERLPAPKRSVLGRERDEHIIDRTRLSSALNGTDDAIARAREAEARLREQLGNPEQIRSELDGLDREIRQLTNERDRLLNDLTDRELQAPGEWAKTLLGERPAGSRADDWDAAVRRVARYRIEYADHRPGRSARPRAARPPPGRPVAARARDGRARRATPRPRTHPRPRPRPRHRVLR